MIQILLIKLPMMGRHGSSARRKENHFLFLLLAGKNGGGKETFLKHACPHEKEIKTQHSPASLPSIFFIYICLACLSLCYVPVSLIYVYPSASHCEKEGMKTLAHTLRRGMEKAQWEKNFLSLPVKEVAFGDWAGRQVGWRAGAIISGHLLSDRTGTYWLWRVCIFPRGGGGEQKGCWEGLPHLLSKHAPATREALAAHLLPTTSEKSTSHGGRRKEGRRRKKKKSCGKEEEWEGAGGRACL